MPTAELKTTVVATGGNAQVQCANALKQIEALVTAAGARAIHRGSDDNDVDDIHRVYRWTAYDPYWSRADLFALLCGAGNNNGTTGTGYLYTDFDYSNIGAAATVARATTGSWTGGAWQSTGTPASILVRSTSGGSRVVVSGDTDFSLAGVASEMGYTVVCEDGLEAAAFGHSLPNSVNWLGRQIAVEGYGPATDVSVTMLAPSGTYGVANSCHLEVESDGRVQKFLFPTSGALSAYDIAAFITNAAAGWIEATVKELLGGGQRLIVRIPPTREPSAGVVASNSRRCEYIRVTYQDPEFVAAGAGFDFRVKSGLSISSVTTGARGVLAFGTDDIITVGRPAYIGSVAYNVTAGEKQAIVAWRDRASSPGTELIDVRAAIFDKVPAGQSGEDIVEIYDYCDRNLGSGRYGGTYAATLKDNPLASLTTGAGNVTLVLNCNGEALRNLEAGQHVTIKNNAMAVQFAVESTAQVGRVNALIENTDTGAIGIVRAVSGSTLVVDTLDNSTNPTEAPWKNGDEIQILDDPDNPRDTSSPSPTLISSAATSGSASIGWFGVFRIVSGPTFVEASSGDVRVEITIDTDEPGLNAAFTAAPGMTVGVHSAGGLNITSFNTSGPTVSATAETIPVSSAVSSKNYGGKEVRSIETGLMNPEPRGVPNFDIWQNDFVQILRGGGPAPSGRYGGIAHLRSINVSGDVDSNDALLDDGDTERQWLATQVEHTDKVGGTTTQPSLNALVCVGPGGSGLVS